MSPSVRLGLRLAVGTPGQRARSALVVVATSIGAWLLLSTLAVGHGIAVTQDWYSSVERQRLALSIVAAVALPILVLATSVARLSAAVRDRRLGNLRLLGLAASDTRTVAAVEAGAAAVAGTLVGAVAYVATRPMLAHLSLGGHRWAPGTLDPRPLGWLLVVVGLPALVCAAAVVPVRLRTTSALARARRGRTRRPSVWWAVPLLVGVALCLVQVASPHNENPGAGSFMLFFAGAILSGLGVVLVAPWVVRGLADLLVARAPGPVSRIAARRLQSQPGSVVRVISALMIGLFLVTGARSVLLAFEETSQYVDADAALHRAQRIPVRVSAHGADTLAAHARSVDGVTDVVVVPVLAASTHAAFGRRLARSQRIAADVLVASCAQLTRVQPDLEGCVDAPMAVGTGLHYRGDVAVRSHGTTVLSFAVPQHRLTSPTSGSWPGALAPINADFVLPPDTPGIQALLPHAARTGVVVGPPGRSLPSRLARSGVPIESEPDFGYYDFVGGLRAILWTVAGVVLGVGLLTLMLGGVDRAAARRRELASLQVLGTSPSTLRRAQLLEAAVPTLAGSLLAIATGMLAGATYLRMADLGTEVHLPWTSALVLTGVTMVAALAVSAVTVVATNVRLSPDLIRQE